MLNLTEVASAMKRWEEVMISKSSSYSKLPIDSFVGEVITKFTASMEGQGSKVEELYTQLLERERKVREGSGYHLPLGLVSVVGPGSAGKSTFVRQLIDQAADPDTFKLVSMGEVGSFMPFDIKACIEMAHGTDRVLVVDSWKDVWNDWHFANTALQTGGIYTSLTAFLGMLSQALFMAGKTMLVVFNPQTSGERETVYQMLNTQSAGMIRMSSAAVGNVEYAQGRSIVPGAVDVTIEAGIPVQREFIFEKESDNVNSGFSSLFHKPII